MALVTVAGGLVRTVGELIIVVTEDDEAAEAEAAPAEAAAGRAAVGAAAARGRGLTVEVLRRWGVDERSGPLPGEERILKLFKAEFEDLVGRAPLPPPTHFACQFGSVCLVCSSARLAARGAADASSVVCPPSAAASQKPAAFQLGGLLAAAFAFALPALPTLPGMNSDSAPGGYRWAADARGCDLFT